MKKLIVLFVSLTISNTAVFAQGAVNPKLRTTPKKEVANKTPEQRAAGCANRLEKNLGLSVDQKKKVQSLALVRATRMEELRNLYQGKEESKQVWRDERKKAREDFKEGLKTTLSAEQYAKWEADKKEKHCGPGNGNEKCKKASRLKDPAEHQEQDADEELDGK